MIELIVWIVVGFVAGLLAKAIMPGTANEPSGFLMTTILGIVGAIVGGFLWRALTNSPSTGISIGSILVATVGAILVIGVLRMFTRSTTA